MGNGNLEEIWTVLALCMGLYVVLVVSFSWQLVCKTNCMWCCWYSRLRSVDAWPAASSKATFFCWSVSQPGRAEMPGVCRALCCASSFAKPTLCAWFCQNAGKNEAKITVTGGLVDIFFYHYADIWQPCQQLLFWKMIGWHQYYISQPGGELKFTHFSQFLELKCGIQVLTTTYCLLYPVGLHSSIRKQSPKAKHWLSMMQQTNKPLQYVHSCRGSYQPLPLCQSGGEIST